MLKKIMIIDDQEAVRMLLKHYLSKFYEVIEHSSATDAMRFLLEGHIVDAIITDIIMPEMTGNDFLQIGKNRFGDKMPPVIMLSCCDTNAEKVNSLLQGAQDYLVKPFHPEELRIRLEAVLSKHEEVNRLQESNSELMHFAYAVSHDLNQPLRMVQSYLSILEKTLEPTVSPLQKECIRFAIDGATRMEHMIHELLNLAKADQAIKSEKVSLTEAIAIVKENLKVLIKEKNANIIVDELPSINAEQTQVVRLLQNLIENGIKYNESEQPTILISSENHFNEIKLKVSDNGIGISKEYREAAFQLFRRLPNAVHYDGTGIGLAICKKIVQKLDGSIEIEDSSIGGTSFNLSFPIAC